MYSASLLETKTTKKLALLWCSIFIIFQAAGCSRPAPTNQPATGYYDESIIHEAYLNHRSDIFVEASGVVVKVLDDDNVAPRHQRFIVRLDSGQTVLITHNIDIAPRVVDLQVGERVYFRGEYEYNDKGGVIHWTHHDPAAQTLGGWLEYRGKKYY